MEKHHIINIIRRWFWFFVVAAIVGGVTTYFASRNEPAVYETAARLIVGPGIDSPNPDLNALRAGGQLMQTYAELPSTGPFAQSIINELGLELTPEELSDRIDVTPNPETQILTIRVWHASPTTAVAIANTAAETLVRLSPSGSVSAAALLREDLRTQAARVDDTITDIEASIAELEQAFVQANNIEQQRLILDQLRQERDRLTSAQDNLTRLYESLQEATTNQVKIIEPARAATPIMNQLWLKIAIGSLSGLVLSMVLVFAFEYFTDSIATPDELKQASDLPVLGAVARHQPLYGTGRRRLAVQALPNSETAENYRTLGAKLLFSADGSELLPSIVFTGADDSEDIGELAANLAVVLAQTGNRVALVDANLHKPTIGQLFGLVDRCGLTDVLTGECEVDDLTVIDWAPGLSVLPSGSITYNSFAMLASPQMTNLVNELERRTDVTIIATSPVTTFAESLFLASRAGGVILVAHSGKSERRAIARAVDSLRSVGAHIIGTVLNQSRHGSVRMGASPTSNGRADGRGIASDSVAEWKPASQLQGDPFDLDDLNLERPSTG